MRSALKRAVARGAITGYVISEDLGVLAYLLGKQQLCLVPLSYLTYQDHT
jgi:hypothetical protein